MGNQSKEEVAKVLGLVLGVLIVSVLVGILFASFVTFVIGLFVAYEFTLLNVLKVWAGLVALNLVLGRIKGK